mgnify:CR=1 FL=1
MRLNNDLFCNSAAKVLLFSELARKEEELFFKYIKAAFSNKRKNIVNNLATLGYSKDKIKEILNQVEISENERAENISIDKFIELIDIFEGR